MGSLIVLIKEIFSACMKEACDEQNRTRILGSSYLALGGTFVEMVGCCICDKEQQKTGYSQNGGKKRMRKGCKYENRELSTEGEDLDWGRKIHMEEKPIIRVTKV